MYGGMYGGMGMGYGMNGMGYGMNGMYGGGYGMPGMPMDPNNPSLSQQLESTTQHTFALLHSIVQTFTGLSQMLESTFMATHSSFLRWSVSSNNSLIFEMHSVAFWVFLVFYDG